MMLGEESYGEVSRREEARMGFRITTSGKSAWAGWGFPELLRQGMQGPKTGESGACDESTSCGGAQGKYLVPGRLLHGCMDLTAWPVKITQDSVIAI
jgi:hypothetical protein